MYPYIEKKFGKIGARVQFVADTSRRANTRTSPVSLDIATVEGEERFVISVREADRQNLDLTVLEVRPEDRHLVLLARNLDENGRALTKEHFLCGHDERHLFVAAVQPVSTVAAAKASLKPPEVRLRDVNLKKKMRNRRKNKSFVRQGEWFFIPATVSPPPALINKNEPLRRGRGSKAHIAQFAYRSGGETVQVCNQYPNGLTHREYKALIEANPRARNYNWRTMQRNAAVYVRGTVRHPDHATIVLDTWHRVVMNRERQTETVAFLD